MAKVGCDPVGAREELERVLAGSGFAQNERLSRFLRFVVERQLEGRGDEIKESVIGIEVFNRRPDFDPKQDSIVRTEAARLRSRLADYYAGEGRRDAVVIEVPKGGYTPVFRSIDTSRQPPPFWTKRLWTVAALAVLVLLLAAGAWTLHRTGEPLAIAVLPLENLNREPDTDYLADGLTDEIIRNLSIIEGLQVRSRTSSFAFKGKPRNAREAGKELGADYLVEGSVMRVGTRIRVDAQLVRVRDDVPLWSQRFDRDSGDVFAVQDEISTQVANSLRLQLGRGRRRYETSPAAYDLYLRARAVWYEGRPPASTALLRPAAMYAETISLYEQAIARDPRFAPAYAGLASTFAIRSVQFPLDHPPDELTLMRTAAEKAIELDPLLAEAHAAVGSMYARSGDWTRAEQSFRRAIEIDPNTSSIRSDFAYWVLAVQGRLDEALAQLRSAQRADPLSPPVHQLLAFVLIYMGRYEEATGQCVSTPGEQTIRTQCLAQVRSGQGRMQEAVQLLESDPSLTHNPQTRGLLGYAYARSGRTHEAKQMAVQAKFPNERALIRVGLGDKDGAFEALDQMTALGAQRVGAYLNFPEFALLRGDPRLAGLRRSLGLPEQTKP